MQPYLEPMMRPSSPALSSCQGGLRGHCALAAAALAVAAKLQPARLQTQMRAAAGRVSLHSLHRPRAAGVVIGYSRRDASSVASSSASSSPPSSSSNTALCPDTSAQVVQLLWPSPYAATATAAAARHAGVGRVAQVPPVQRSGAIVLQQAYSSGSRGGLSPRVFESRLRQSAPMLKDMHRVSAVCASWSARVEQNGWPAAHEYLYQEPGTKRQLQQRYLASARQLQVKEWFQQRLPPPIAAAAAVQSGRLLEVAVPHVAAFMA
eukprot:TRINITY_DN26845_c0_g1_i2.p1 TRINITY_DN26845_c0_g1~~TRINITY_DN26845_c0_g1_i2.p1  ORF type:complete len:264 (-),score=61.27 TRINITY_DN26845_c0_g1_i2:177-968(-)